MDERETIQLTNEIEGGHKAQIAWDSYFEPFFKAKSAELYQTFKDLPTSNHSGLVTIKLQSNALASLEEELKHHIFTGKMAQQAMNEAEEKQNGQ